MFSIGERQFASVANFWDPSMDNMEADSEVLEIATKGDDLVLTPLQKFRNSGAHGVEYFEAMGEAFLTVPYYYGKANVIYKWVPGRNDGRTEGRFVEFQTLNIEGPAQCEAYRIGGKTFLAIGENFASVLGIYELDVKQQKFVLRQKLPTPGAGAMAFLAHTHSVTGEALHFMASTSYHSGTAAAWRTQTPIFKWACPGGSSGGDGGSGGGQEDCSWELMQKLATRGPRECTSYEQASFY
jgi:hypothetical protein